MIVFIELVSFTTQKSATTLTLLLVKQFVMLTNLFYGLIPGFCFKEIP